MKKEFELHIRNKFPDLFGQNVLIANSSGVDSMVLSDLLKRLEIPFSIAYCHFQLRKEADREILFLEDWAQQHQLPFYNHYFETQKYADDKGLSIQMAARELRYQWFDQLANEHQFDAILTAHHLNDQLETFLMNSLRATGPKGLLGIPHQQGKVQRPLLPFTKRQIIDYAHTQNLNWCEDSSNATDTYQRNRVRHHITLALVKEYPQWASQFQKTLNWNTQQQAFVTDGIAQWKKQYWKETTKGIRVEVTPLQKHSHLAFLSHELFSPFGFHAKEVEKLLGATSGKALFSETHKLQRERQHLQLERTESKEWISYSLRNWADLESLPLSIEQTIVPPTLLEPHQAYLDSRQIHFPLQLRRRQQGDFFYPTGMTGKKSISKYFKDEKYSQQQKENQWLLCKEQEVIWVVGKRCNRKFVCAPKSSEGVLLTFTQ
ncbi:MAG: tRNA lysidine(34) synthetase TilS [Flavobacteriaceae bacterium TMED120]|nr:MAG: tRNA lysidine(34) synthetase TilS [Flavobacteriaceae bacterium TMED120]HCQ24853.1 tRNA lysidine(34) synthetase TilS [Flavobacteriaceae bacterium]